VGVIAVRTYDRSRPRRRLGQASRSELIIFPAFSGQGPGA
jgi:hypothetical protein